jgi:hypothetical protein
MARERIRHVHSRKRNDGYKLHTHTHADTLFTVSPRDNVVDKLVGHITQIYMIIYLYIYTPKSEWQSIRNSGKKSQRPCFLFSSA